MYQGVFRDVGLGTCSSLGQTAIEQVLGRHSSPPLLRLLAIHCSCNPLIHQQASPNDSHRTSTHSFFTGTAQSLSDNCQPKMSDINLASVQYVIFFRVYVLPWMEVKSWAHYLKQYDTHPTHPTYSTWFDLIILLSSMHLLIRSTVCGKILNKCW